MPTHNCFISYSYDSPIHMDWVRERLATSLRRNGVAAELDQWNNYLGDLPAYMEQSIRKAEYVLIVCTPKYKKKAEAGLGGVGYEKGIITGEIFTGSRAAKRKFIPIIREGNVQKSVPAYLKGNQYFDFSKDDAFDAVLARLLACIYKVNLAPVLHPTPALPQKWTIPINEPDLDIFLTGDGWNWEARSEMKYVRKDGGMYQLEFTPLGTAFKHFAICDPWQIDNVIRILGLHRYKVTGSGDLHPHDKRNRVWFLLPDYLEDGAPWPINCNTWTRRTS